MTSNIRTRHANAARHCTAELARTITILEAADVAGVHPDARYAFRAIAIELRRLSKIIAGDIGEGAEEWESEPITTPVEVPAEPEKVPA